MRILKRADELAWDADYRTGRPEHHGDRDDRKRLAAAQKAMKRHQRREPKGPNGAR